MNRIIYIIMGVILLLIIGVIAFRPSPVQPPIPQPSGQTIVVSYTKAGYSPKILQIKAGTQITFKNENSWLMWTASDPHPFHTTFPEFDSLVGIPQGESYSYIFSAVGSWDYHNHLRPADGGTIIVK